MQGVQYTFTALLYLTIIIKKGILDIASCIGYILIVLFLVAVIIKLYRDNKEEETRMK